MTKILIVEDEAKIARFVELELAHEGYEVQKAADGRSGVEAALTGGFDLVLLDVMLPELNGLEVLRRIRRESDVPVIMLTARDAVMDKVSGLDAGADDYITKPFAIEELLARVRVALKKRAALLEAAGAAGGAVGKPVDAGAFEATGGVAAAAAAHAAGTADLPAGAAQAAGTPGVSAGGAPAQPGSASPEDSSPVAAAPGFSAAGAVPATADQDRHVLAVKDVVLDVERHQVTANGAPVELTLREFEVLRALMEHKDIVLNRERIAQLALGYDYVGETNIIDVYIRHLRAKIDDRHGIKLISTVRGVGYVIREG